jgi:hypothetical protein
MAPRTVVTELVEVRSLSKPKCRSATGFQLNAWIIYLTPRTATGPPSGSRIRVRCLGYRFL